MYLDKAGVRDVLQNHDFAPTLRVLHAVAWLGSQLRTSNKGLARAHVA